jgi:MoaA/NifB/PqqE/SkfB family radical SAM enzyme
MAQATNTTGSVRGSLLQGALPPGKKRTTKGSDSIRSFLMKKAVREFRPAYLRAYFNYGLFHATQWIEQWTPIKFTQHRFLKPVALMIQINKVCNLNCSFCFVNELNEKSAKEFTISDETFDRMMSLPLTNSLTRVGFTGGEPLLHPKIFELIDRAKKTVPITTINTNFGLAGRVHQGERRIDRLNRCGLDMITVSLYEQNVKEIEQYALELGDHMYKRLSFVVSKGQDPFHSYTRMEEVAGMAARLGFHGVYFQNFDSAEGVPAQNANLNKLDITGFTPLTRNDEYLAVKERVQKEFGNQLGISFPVMKKPRVEGGRKPFSCYQPDFQIGVDGKGSIAPCCNIDRLPEFGSIFAKEGWNTKFFQRVRAGIKKKDVAPTSFCANCTYLDVNTHDI